MVAMEADRSPESVPTVQTNMKKTNFSIAAIMSGLQAAQSEPVCKEEPIEVVEKVVKKEKKSRISETSNCADLDNVKCTLDNKDLWDKFCEFGTEMIITRTGRRMFPTVRVTLSNLDSCSEPGTKYLVLLDIVPCDNKRYRYAYHRSAWLVAGKADPPPPSRLHSHPDGPFSVDQLKKQVIGFEKVKITNNETDNSGQIILNSMHKFQPRVYLVRRKEGDNGPVTNLEQEQYRTFVFPETQFTAVTAYQNQCITKLKIESNPFAKGFRDSAGSDYDSDLPHQSPFMSHLPGGMPGLDPFARLRAPEPNNNLMLEKARHYMMMQAPSPFMPHPHQSTPSLPYSLPLSPELIARYSAIQASLSGLYNPALLAALRTSSVPTSITSSLPSPTSPEQRSPPNHHRFSPYHIPPRPNLSPSTPPSSPLSVDKPRTPSPGISPPPSQFPTGHTFPIFR